MRQLFTTVEILFNVCVTIRFVSFACVWIKKIFFYLYSFIKLRYNLYQNLYRKMGTKLYPRNEILELGYSKIDKSGGGVNFPWFTYIFTLLYSFQSPKSTNQSKKPINSFNRFLYKNKLNIRGIFFKDGIYYIKSGLSIKYCKIKMIPDPRICFNWIIIITKQ